MCLAGTERIRKVEVLGREPPVANPSIGSGIDRW